LVDAQAAYESNMTMGAVLLSGANYLFHSAGWNEAGLSANFAKFMLDCEQTEMFYKLGQGITLDGLEESIADLGQIGPGGHFLGTDYTRENFRSAFYMPEYLDNNSFDQWQSEGALDANTRGLTAARRALETYEAPPMDPAVEEELRAFIAKREAVLPEGVE